MWTPDKKELENLKLEWEKIHPAIKKEVYKPKLFGENGTFSLGK